jgi:hypothetical protein
MLRPYGANFQLLYLKGPAFSIVVNSAEFGLNQAREFLWQRTGEYHVLSAHRVRKPQRARVQAQALRGIALRTVFFVPDDRTLGLCKLHSDLVATAGFQGQFDQ